ncbi:MAG: hypothetical protein ACREBU_05190 [Nitrososphaera sp.]
MIQKTHKSSTLAAVFRQPFYILLSVATATSMGLLYHYLTLSIMALSSVIETQGPLYFAVSVALTFVSAALAGINISLLVFRIKGSRFIAIKGAGSSTAFGSTMMAFTPGCPACTTPLVAVLSAIGGVAVFPLQGLEFKIISSVSLAFSTYWLSRGLRHNNVCDTSGR